MMFQSEMENLELDLEYLGSSEQLFADELFSVAAASGDNGYAQDIRDVLAQQEEDAGDETQPDLLQRVIDEIKMAPIVKVEEDNIASAATDVGITNDDVSDSNGDQEMKSILADYNDLLFEEPQVMMTSAATAEAEAADVEEVAAVASPGGASTNSGDDHQSLIDEMEEFLSYHEQPSSKNSVDDVTMQEEQAISASASANSTGVSEADAAQAEQIVEALVSGDLTLDHYSRDQQRRIAAQAGYSAAAVGATISNISEIVTEDGNTVVIVIANDDNKQQTTSAAATTTARVVSAAASPSSSGRASPEAASSIAGEDDSDSDWTPDSPAAAATTRKAKTTKATSSSSPLKGTKRGPYKQRAGGLSSRYNVKDKRERKKMQNVVAARRYRDKKKGEQAELEEEEQELSERNSQLSEKLREMENEVKTLKKLMVELGLVKVSEATAAKLST